MPLLRRYVDFASPTLLILLLSAAWSGWAAAQGDGPIDAAWAGGSVVPAVLDAGAQLWRLLCAGWLHTDAAHALGNLPALLFAGLALARAGRRDAVLPVWIGGALLGCVASWLFTRTWAHGASGGNAALASAVLWVGLRRWRDLDAMGRRWVLVGSLPWLILLAMPRTSPVDHAAHLAGALSGPLLSAGGRRAGLGALGATLLAFGLMAWTALRPIEAVLRVPTAPLPDLCAGPALTDGLSVICRAPLAGAADRWARMPARTTHQMTLADGYAVIVVPGPRARRTLRVPPSRFFDGSPDLR